MPKFNPQPKPVKSDVKKVYHLKRTPLVKKPYKIKPRSAKRAQEDKSYNAMVKAWLHGKICPECGLPATEVHHKKGRIGKLLLDIRFWLPVTPDCHKKIELNPEWAKEKGYSLSRLAK